MTLNISFDDIKKKIAAERDPSKLPAELGMMYGGADEAAKQSKFGPSIWDQVWPYRSPLKPGPKGERVKSWDWKLKEGEDGLCVMAQIPTPIPVHQVLFGWNEKKGWPRKEWVRCLHRRFEYNATKKVGTIVEMDYKCPFCTVLGPERWNTIQVGGVIDLREGVEPLIDAYGQAIANPPRALIIGNDAGQKAIMAGLAERFRNGRPMIGTIFQVSRGKGKTTASIGTNWIPMLDRDVPESEIAKIYYPIDMKLAFPALAPEATNQFKPEEIPGLVKHILERHVFVSIKYGDKMGKSFRGFDEAGAIAYGLDLKALTAAASTAAEEGEGGEEKTAAATPRGVQIAFTPPVTIAGAAPIPSSTATAGGNLWGLSDLGAAKPEAPAATPPTPAPAAAPEGPLPWDAAQEQEIEPDDIIKMSEAELLDVIKEWNITPPRKKDKANLIMRILTHKEGFGMEETAAATKAGLMAVPAAPTPAAPAAPAYDRAVLMDRAATPIEKLLEIAKSAGVTSIPKDDKGRVLRSALVAAIVSPVTPQTEEAPEPVATPGPATPAPVTAPIAQPPVAPTAAPTPGAARKNVWDD